MYVMDEQGNKVVCRHPGESPVIAKTLGIPLDDVSAWMLMKYDKISEETKQKIEDNIGMRLQYICLNCLAENYLDKNNEEMKCAECGSTELKYVAELVHNTCPKCHKGTIEIVDRGVS